MPKKSWWPEVTYRGGAKEAARQGAGAALFVAIVTAIAGILAICGIIILPGISALSLVDAGLFGLIAWRIHKMSRTWSIVGALLYLSEKAYGLYLHGLSTVGVLMTVILLLAFINGIRGTFAYAKLAGSPIEIVNAKE